MHLVFYFFLKDIDDCVNHTCVNGGLCIDGVNNYSCSCLPGFSGGRCETGGYLFLLFVFVCLLTHCSLSFVVAAVFYILFLFLFGILRN